MDYYNLYHEVLHEYDTECFYNYDIAYGTHALIKLYTPQDNDGITISLIKGHGDPKPWTLDYPGYWS